MNGCNKSFNTTEALQRHLQRHFDRTPTPPPPPAPPPPPRAVAILKGTNKLSKKNNNSSSQGSLSDLELASSLSCGLSTDEDYSTEEGFGDAEDESDDSYAPGSQSTSESRVSCDNACIASKRKMSCFCSEICQLIHCGQ